MCMHAHAHLCVSALNYAGLPSGFKGLISVWTPRKPWALGAKEGFHVMIEVMFLQLQNAEMTEGNNMIKGNKYKFLLYQK